MPIETPDQLAQALADYKTLERKHRELRRANTELLEHMTRLQVEVDRLQARGVRHREVLMPARCRLRATVTYVAEHDPMVTDAVIRSGARTWENALRAGTDSIEDDRPMNGDVVRTVKVEVVR